MRDIIEETWSTRRLRREMSRGQKIIPKLINKKNMVITDRNKIIAECAEYFKNIYDIENNNK